MSRTYIIVVLLACWAAQASAAPGAELWPYWNVRDEASTLQVDHSTWQQFLDLYVVEAADGIHRVAYKVASADAGQTILTRYLEQVAAIDPRKLSSTEQLAYWINLYNALTIQVILNYPKKSSILRMGKAFFAAGPLSSGPWDDKLITIAGTKVTLNDIEHRILRPIWQDRRIHYAVNCASLGCPNLRKMAYQSHNVEELLSAAEHSYVNHPRGVQFDANGNLAVSSIYDWYSADFAANEADLLTYLAAHHDTLQSRLSTYRGSINYHYDWQLNSVTQR